MRAWEKCKDGAQRSSVLSLHFYGGWALPCGMRSIDGVNIPQCMWGARIPLLTFFVILLP